MTHSLAKHTSRWYSLALLQRWLLVAVSDARNTGVTILLDCDGTKNGSEVRAAHCGVKAFQNTGIRAKC